METTFAQLATPTKIAGKNITESNTNKQFRYAVLAFSNANTFFCTDSQINLETNSLNKDTNLSIQIRKYTSKSRGGFSKLDL